MADLITTVTSQASPSELYPDQLKTTVTLIGAGGIGSGVCPMIIRAGVRAITIWDDDYVAPVNLQMQHFDAADLSKNKARVLARKAKSINPQVRATAVPKHFINTDYLDGLVISAVDSMESRRAIFEAVESQHERVALFVDGRITKKGDHVSLYFIDPSSNIEMENYKGWLHDEAKVYKTPRSESMTAQVPYMLSGLMGEALAGWAIDRSHPWKVTYDAKAHHIERYAV